MKKKNLFLLGLGYFGGVTVASLYSKDRGPKLKEDLEVAHNSDDKSICKVLFRNFIDIHREVYEDTKDVIINEENIALYNQKKEEFLTLLDDYKAKGEEELSKLKDLGETYSKEALKKAEEYYEEKLAEINEFKGEIPELVEEYREKLVKYLKQLHKKIKKFEK
ncbi:MAG: hypothetical protein N4A38_00625 [Candidatus Gracilibacteria bacterium]|nr:hypothetical protein [Candidatus Gracilibacteria bacterium]